MKSLPAYQKGASAIGTIIILVILGFGAYVAIQYVPQMIESKSIDSILTNVKDSQKSDPVKSVAAAKEKVVKLLQINEMNDMMDAFTVKQKDDAIIIDFSYDRELNLVYKTRPMHYEKTLRLN
ncbi:MAG: hypothetical protein WBS20_17330 [Lysobacterales bacterium]